MERIKFNQFQIKIFMALLMVTDHLNHVPGLISDNLASVFHVLTRCVAVWFAYSAVVRRRNCGFTLYAYYLLYL